MIVQVQALLLQQGVLVQRKKVLYNCSEVRFEASWRRANPLGACMSPFTVDREDELVYLA